MDNTLEERLLILLLVIFFIFIVVYKPNYHDSMTNVQIISDNKDSVIIKENNITKKVSKVCTHMGCILKLDHDKQKLNCPCHGSQFGLNGQVISGTVDTNLTVTTLAEKFQNYENRKKLEW